MVEIRLSRQMALKNTLGVDTSIQEPPYDTNPILVSLFISLLHFFHFPSLFSIHLPCNVRSQRL